MSEYYGFFNKVMYIRLTTALKSGNMRRFEANYTVSAEQKKLITFGAVLFTRNLESCRTFRLRADKSKIVDMLFSWWDINNPEGALRTAGKLSTANGHTPVADRVYKALEPDGRIRPLRQSANDIAEFENRIECYKTARDILLDLGYTERELSEVKSTSAWDYGRAGFIARYCVKAGYMEEDEAWGFMETAAKSAASVYGNWREYTAGYVFGRALGYTNDSRDIYAVLRYLLNNSNSPFNEAAIYN